MEETLNLENSLAFDIKSEQCGSIFYSEKLKYFISCINCSEKFFDINIFSEHFDEQHLICSNSDPLISIITGSNNNYQKDTENSNKFQTQRHSKTNVVNEGTGKRIGFEQSDVELNSIITPNSSNYNEENFKNLEANTVEDNKTKKYVCSICPLSFLWLSALKRHVKSVHVDTRDFVCKICKKDYTSKYRVAEHIRRIHQTAYNDDLTYKKSNKNKFTLSKTLEANGNQSIAKEKHNKTNIEDENSGKTQKVDILTNSSPDTPSKDEEITHEYHEIKLNKAIVRDLEKNSHKKLKSSNELKLEMKILYTCKICRESFNTLTSLRSHRVKKHSLQLSMKIQQRRNKTGKVHNKNDTSNPDKSPLGTETKYSCKVCSSKFVIFSALQRHIDIFHSNKTDFFCQYCKKYFETKVDLEIHSKKFHTDNSEIPFKCPICYDLFSTRQAFRQHYKLKHTQKEKKLHKCSFCDKFFKFTHDKIIHERSHTKETFAICEYCGLSFITISSLNAHRRRRHSKELNLKIEKQEHKCLTCGKVYKHKSYLAEHAVVHSKIRKYICSICSESFAWPYVLRRHIMNVHNDSRDFVCKVCEKDFKSKSKVAEHIKKTHKITFNNDLFYKKIKEGIELNVK